MTDAKDGDWLDEWRRKHVAESWVYRWLQASKRLTETQQAVDRNPSSAILDAAAMEASGDLCGIEISMVDELALMLRRAAKLQPDSLRTVLRELLRDIVGEVYEEFDSFKRNIRQEVRKIVAEERREYMEARRIKRELKGIS